VNEAWDSQPFSTFLRTWIPSYLGLTDRPLSGRDQTRMNRALRAALRRHRTGMPQPVAAWVVKNPRSMYLIPYLADHCPGMRFVHVVRDGRDMAFATNQRQLASYYDAWFGAAAEKPLPVRAIELWSKTNLDASLAGKQALAGRYLCVRLEDLCDDPEQKVREILDFVGVQADAEQAARVVKRPATLARWRQQDPALLAAISAAGKPGLVHFGYLEAT